MKEHIRRTVVGLFVGLFKGLLVELFDELVVRLFVVLRNLIGILRDTHVFV